MAHGFHRLPLEQGARHPARPLVAVRPQYDVHEALRQSIRGEQPGTQETLKGIAFSDPNPDCGDHFDKSKPCPSSVYGISDQHVVLDSAQAGEISPEKGTVQFNFAPHTAGREKHIGVRETLDNVIQIRTVKFCIPLPLLVEVPSGTISGLTLTASPGADDPRGDTNPISGLRSQLAHCPRVTLYFNELGEECFFNHKKKRYHFEYEASIEGITGEPGARMVLTPLNPIFTFTEPKQIHGLTMQFFTPDAPLRFPADRFHPVHLFVTTTGNIRIEVPTHVGGQAIDLTSLLVPGDRVFFDDVSITSDATITSEMALNLSNYLSREDGLFVAGGAFAPVVSSLYTDPVINTGLTPANDYRITIGSEISMRVAKNRIRAPFVFRKVKEGLTNYIAP